MIHWMDVVDNQNLIYRSRVMLHTQHRFLTSYYIAWNNIEVLQFIFCDAFDKIKIQFPNQNA